MKPEEKIEQYKAYAKSIESEDDIVDTLGYIIDSKFKLFSEQALGDYFKAREIPYNEKTDISELAVVLGEELDSRRGTRNMVDEVMNLVNYSNTKKNIKKLKMNKEIDFSKLDNLKKNLEESIISFYDVVVTGEKYYTEFPANFFNIANGNIFYKTNKNKLKFGIESNDWTIEPSKRSCIFKFQVKVKKSKKGNYSINIYGATNSDLIKIHQSPSEFIESYKSMVLNNSDHTNTFTEYLKMMLDFTYNLRIAKENVEDKISSKINDLLNREKKQVKQT